MPASILTLGASASRRRAMACTSSTMASRVFRTLASEWAALADTGMVSFCAPASSAACAPLRLGTKAMTVTPVCVSAWRSTAAVSASCGSRCAGTKEPTSISCTPAATKASIQRHLSAVDMMDLTDCKPSRGPTSLMRTAPQSFMRPHQQVDAAAWPGCWQSFCATRGGRR